jgi:hypothetical protein
MGFSTSHSLYPVVTQRGNTTAAPRVGYTEKSYRHFWSSSAPLVCRDIRRFNIYTLLCAHLLPGSVISVYFISLSLFNIVRSESRCALRLRYVDLVVSIEVTVEVCCCFTVFSS